MEKTGLSREDAYLIFVHNVQGNLAVNRLLGWRRGPEFAHAQELLGAYSEGGMRAVSVATIPVAHLEREPVPGRRLSYAFAGRSGNLSAERYSAPVTELRHRHLGFSLSSARFRFAISDPMRAFRSSNMALR